MKNDLETAQSDVFFPDFPEKKGENAPLQQKFLPSQRRWQACKKFFWPPSAAGGFAKKFYDLLDVSFPSFLRNRPHCERPFEVAPWEGFAIRRCSFASRSRLRIVGRFPRPVSASNGDE